MDICLPVFTKVSATVPCTSGTDCNTAYTAIDPTDAVTVGLAMYATTACTQAIAAEGASTLAVKAAIAATTMYVML